VKNSDHLFYLGLLCSIPAEVKLIEFSPFAGLILPVIIAGFLAKRMFPLLRKKHNRYIAAVSAFLSLIAVSQPSQAIEFSLLLGKTEEMVKTCIFGQIEGFSVATFIVFGTIRMFYIVPVALEISEWNKKRQHNQNFSEEVKFICIAIVGMLFVGVLEPFLVKTCS
jgi:hypothetical protein